MQSHDIKSITNEARPQAASFASVTKAVLITNLLPYFAKKEISDVFSLSKNMNSCAIAFWSAQVKSVVLKHNLTQLYPYTIVGLRKAIEDTWPQKLINDFNCDPEVANNAKDAKALYERIYISKYKCHNFKLELRLDAGLYTSFHVAYQKNKPCPPLFDSTFDAVAFEKLCKAELGEPEPDEKADKITRMIYEARYEDKRNRDLNELLDTACTLRNIAYAKSLLEANNEIANKIINILSPDFLLQRVITTGNQDFVEWFLNISQLTLKRSPHVCAAISSGNVNLLTWILKHLNLNISEFQTEDYASWAIDGENTEFLATILEKNTISNELLQKWCDDAGYSSQKIVEFFYTKKNLLPRISTCLHGNHLEIIKYVATHQDAKILKEQLKNIGISNFETLEIAKYALEELKVTINIGEQDIEKLYTDKKVYNYILRKCLVKDFDCDPKIVDSIDSPLAVYKAIFTHYKTTGKRDIFLIFKKENYQLKLIQEESPSDEKDKLITLKFTLTTSFLVNDLILHPYNNLAASIGDVEIISLATTSAKERITSELMINWSNKAASSGKLDLVKWLYENKAILASIMYLDVNNLTLIRYVISRTPNSAKKTSQIESHFRWLPSIKTLEVAKYVVMDLGLRFDLKNYNRRNGLVKEIENWYINFLKEEELKKQTPHHVDVTLDLKCDLDSKNAGQILFNIAIPMGNQIRERHPSVVKVKGFLRTSENNYFIDFQGYRDKSGNRISPTAQYTIQLQPAAPCDAKQSVNTAAANK